MLLEGGGLPRLPSAPLAFRPASFARRVGSKLGQALPQHLWPTLNQHVSSYNPRPLAPILSNLARNSPATPSNIEFASLELQRFPAVSKNYRIKLCATFVWARPAIAHRHCGQALPQHLWPTPNQHVSSYNSRSIAAGSGAPETTKRWDRPGLSHRRYVALDRRRQNLSQVLGFLRAHFDNEAAAPFGGDPHDNAATFRGRFEGTIPRARFHRCHVEDSSQSSTAATCGGTPINLTGKPHTFLDRSPSITPTK